MAESTSEADESASEADESASEANESASGADGRASGADLRPWWDGERCKGASLILPTNYLLPRMYGSW